MVELLPTGTLVQEGDHPWPWVNEGINKEGGGKEKLTITGNGLGRGRQFEGRRKKEKL